MRKKKSKYCWWAAPVLTLSLVALIVAGLFVAQQVGNYARFREMRDAIDSSAYYPGTYVDGISLNGASYEQALEHWRDNIEPDYYNSSVVIDLNGAQTTIKAADFGYESNFESVLREAYQLGRAGSVKERYAKVASIARDKARLSVARTLVNEVSVRKLANDLAASVNTGATSAHVTGFNAETRTFQFAEGEAGYSVDANALYDDIIAAFNAGGGTVRAEAVYVEPTLKVSDIQGLYGEISSAVTNASSSNSNRLSNIALALGTINGTCIEPGETFSFNGLLGKRTTEKGYKAAGAFVNGLVEEEVGGGICQVSTTLFNAAVKANMTVVERSPHSRPVSYVDMGKDAAVNWPDTDLKFTNGTDTPIYLVCELTEKKRVQIYVYGKLFESGGSIVIEAKTTDTLEPGDPQWVPNSELAPGATLVVEDARTGYAAVAYKIYLDANGNEISRELLCKSTYRASGGIIQFGP